MTQLLAIKWGSAPTAQDWRRLSVARVSLGILEKIEPARALQGSPGRILAIGARPDWLCDFAYVESTEDPGLKDALGWCFEMNDYDRTPSDADQLSAWFGLEVKEVESLG